MSVSGVKDNKCFSPVQKYKAQKTETIPANTTTSNPYTVTYTNSNIDSTDCAVVTCLATNENPAFNGVEYEVYIMSGRVVVSFINPTNAAVEVIFNVVVM